MFKNNDSIWTIRTFYYVCVKSILFQHNRENSWKYTKYNMYRINVLTGGEDQIVNSKHKIYYKEKDFALLKEDNEIQKKVKEYLLLGGKITNCLGRLKDNN